MLAKRKMFFLSRTTDKALLNEVTFGEKFLDTDMKVKLTMLA